MGIKAPKSIYEYIKLSKLRVVELLLVTTVPSMIISIYGMPPISLIILTLFGGTCLAVSANVLNQVFEIEKDMLMARTSNRPLVKGTITKTSAVYYSVTLGIIGFFVLQAYVNILAALIALIANLYYVFVYTLYLKSRTKQNIVIGGASGAAPTLIGWAATTGTLDLGAWILFGIVFMWTPAHFWALSILHKDDYANASFPMLPNTASERETIKYIAIYSCSTLLMSLLAAPVLQLGLLYLFIAIALGTHLMINVLHLYQDKSTPGSFFALSNTYLALLFLGIVIDVLWTLRLIEI